MYGATSENPEAYFQRSLLHYVDNFRSDILFFQCLGDSRLQMNSLPTFKEQVSSCTNCQNRQFYEILGGGHTALLESQTAKIELNEFLNSH